MKAHRKSRNSMILTISAVILLGGLCVTANAALIDFEAYADQQNLNGVNLGGVTLTNPTNGIVEIYDDRYGVKYHSATKAIGSFSGNQSVNPIVGVFDTPQTFIKLWAGDAGSPTGDTDSWELEAFDAAVGGNSLGLVSVGDWKGFPYEPLQISAQNIWRFEARWTGSVAGIGYDDLEFIPEPATLCLLGLGGLLLRRRKNA